MTGRRWLVGGAALFLLAVAGWITLVAMHPQVYWQQTDAQVYRDAGAAVLHHRDLYRLALGPARLPFTYPPFAALLFAAASPAPLAVWRLALAVASIACLLVSAWSAARLAGRANPMPVALTVAAVAMWLEPVDMTLHFGQINLLLLALVLADLALPRRWQGVGVGLAAAIKLTPLIFIGYLLLTRRLRAAAIATGTFAATVALGFAVLPHGSAAFWGGRFAQPGDGPERLVNQSLNGLILRATHGGTHAHALWLVAAVLVGCAGLALAAAASRRGAELAGVCLCALTGLLVSPISWTHHWVLLVPALAIPTYRRTRAWLVAGALVVLVAWWPLPVGPSGGWRAGVTPHPAGLLRLVPHDAGAELHWNRWQLLAGDAYVLAGLACALGYALWLGWQVVRTRGRTGRKRTGGADTGGHQGSRRLVPMARTRLFAIVCAGHRRAAAGRKPSIPASTSVEQ